MTKIKTELEIKATKELEQAIARELSSDVEDSEKTLAELLVENNESEND